MVFGNKSAKIPDGLVKDGFVVRPLRGSDVELDYAAVMESRELLRKWGQGTWPEDDFTPEKNLKDLQRHEREHVDREAFTFTVMNSAETECLGCIYIFPCTARWLSKPDTIITGEGEWADYEAVVLFWIRQSRLAEAMDRKLLDNLRPWFAQEWGFDGHLFMTNEQFEQQVTMLEAANLQLRFEVKLPNQPGKNLTYTG